MIDKSQDFLTRVFHTERLLPDVLERYIFLYLVWQSNFEECMDSGRLCTSIKFGAK